MTFDPNTIHPQAKDKLIELGRRFGSSDTLAQAERTQNGYTQHGSVLEGHGYGPADAAALGEYMQALIAAGVTREGTRVGKKVTDIQYLGVMRAGKQLRSRARSVLRNTVSILGMQAGAAEQAAASVVEGALKQTSETSNDLHTLGNQLELLVGALKNTVVADAAKGRGGDMLLTELEAQIPALRTVAKVNAVPRGTPADTELLDLLDGLVVENCRAARRAARSASQVLGVESIAKAFELGELYGPRAKAKGPAGEGGKEGGAPGE